MFSNLSVFTFIEELYERFFKKQNFRYDFHKIAILDVPFSFIYTKDFDFFEKMKV